MIRRILILAGCLIAIAYADSWTPPRGLKQIPVWPKGAEVLSSGIRELDDKKTLAKNPVTNVRIPTYTVYSPKENKSGAALIIFPGGGHLVLAMGLEGTEVCDWFTKAGITCVLVKYRVPYSGCYWDKKTRKNITPEVPMALQDAQGVISTIRYHAKDYGINPKRIGVLGFSAGGNLAVLASTRFKDRSYEPIDEIDQVSCRPDFAVPCYPGHMTMTHKNKTPWEVASQQLNTDIPISKEIPPTLLIHAKDDDVDPIHYSEVYERELRKAGVSVKLKAYESGGHAFGVRKDGKDCDRWTTDVLNWLEGLGMYRREARGSGRGIPLR